MLIFGWLSATIFFEIADVSCCSSRFVDFHRRLPASLDLASRLLASRLLLFVVAACATRRTRTRMAPITLKIVEDGEALSAFVADKKAPVVAAAGVLGKENPSLTPRRRRHCPNVFSRFPRSPCFPPHESLRIRRAGRDFCDWYARRGAGAVQASRSRSRASLSLSLCSF